MKNIIYILFSLNLFGSLTLSQTLNDQTYTDQKINSKEHYFRKQGANFGKSAALSLQNSLASMTSINAIDCNSPTPSSLIFAATGATHVASDISRAHLLRGDMKDEFARLNQIESENNKNGEALISLEKSYNELIDNIEQQRKFIAASIVSNKIAATASYADSLPRTLAQSALIATANTCAAAGSTPQFAALCQGCIQKAYNAINIIRTRSAAASDGGRIPPSFTPGSQYNNIKPLEDNDQTSTDFLFKFQEKQPDFIKPFLNLFTGPAHAMFSCNPACTPCQNVDRNIDQYFARSITALERCPDKLASPTDFLSGVLADQLGAGNTLTPVAISLAPSTASHSYNFLQSPLDKGAMIEATADLAQENFLNLTQNLGIVIQNRNRVRSLIANLERQSNIRDVNNSSGNTTGANLRNGLPKAKFVNSSEFARSSKDFEVTTTPKKEAELRQTLRSKLNIPCVGGTNGQGLCKNANLGDIVYNSQSNSNGILDELISPIELISDLNVEASNGNYSKAHKLATKLSDEKIRAKVDFALSEIKNIVNRELEANGEEIVSFTKHKIGYKAKLSSLTKKAFANSGISIGHEKLNKSRSPRTLSSSPAKNSPLSKAKSFLSNQKQETNFPNSTKPIEKQQIFARDNKDHLINSERILAGVELEYADIIQDPKIPLFEAVSNRYNISARPILLPKRKPTSIKNHQ